MSIGQANGLDYWDNGGAVRLWCSSKEVAFPFEIAHNWTFSHATPCLHSFFNHSLMKRIVVDCIIHSMINFLLNCKIDKRKQISLNDNKIFSISLLCVVFILSRPFSL